MKISDEMVRETKEAQQSLRRQQGVKAMHKVAQATMAKMDPEEKA